MSETDAACRSDTAGFLIKGSDVVEVGREETGGENRSRSRTPDIARVWREDRSHIFDI